jgi:uncharacterized protein (TIGR03000 family)
VVYVPVFVGTPNSALMPAPATVVVRLPADARLTIDGDATVSTGGTRRFVSPPLESGRTYHYTLESEVIRDGQKLTVMRQVAVRAGQDSEVQLNPSSFHVAAK